MSDFISPLEPLKSIHCRCGHPDCAECNPRPKVKQFEAPAEHPQFDISRFEWAKLHLHSLTKKHFFGKATFIFEDGKIVRLVKEENIKP